MKISHHSTVWFICLMAYQLLIGYLMLRFYYNPNYISNAPLHFFKFPFLFVDNPLFAHSYIISSIPI